MTTLTWFFATFALVIASVFAMNTAVDVSGLDTYDLVYRLASSQQADELLIWENSFDQRAWVKARLMNGRDCPELLVLGSSTMGALAASLFPGRHVLNGWLTQPTVEDFEAMTALLEGSGCHPANVVLGIDPWFFNAKVQDERWMSLMPEYLTYHGTSWSKARWRKGWATLKERLNFVTTRQTVDVLLRPSRREPTAIKPTLVRVSPAEYCADDPRPYYIRAYDGHYVSCPRFSYTPIELTRVAERYLATNSHEMAEWREIDSSRLTRLAAVLTRWRALDMQVLILAPPYHPETFRRLQASPEVRENLRVVDTALRDLAAPLGMTYLSLRDPKVPGCEGDDFRDSHHFKASCFHKMFRTVQDAGFTFRHWARPVAARGDAQR